MYQLVHLAYLLLVPAGVAVLMMVAGVHRQTLEWKRPRRICPSCGRDTDRCSCRR